MEENDQNGMEQAAQTVRDACTIAKASVNAGMGNLPGAIEEVAKNPHALTMALKLIAGCIAALLILISALPTLVFSTTEQTAKTIGSHETSLFTAPFDKIKALFGFGDGQQGLAEAGEKYGYITEAGVGAPVTEKAMKGAVHDFMNLTLEQLEKRNNQLKSEIAQCFLEVAEEKDALNVISEYDFASTQTKALLALNIVCAYSIQRGSLDEITAEDYLEWLGTKPTFLDTWLQGLQVGFMDGLLGQWKTPVIKNEGIFLNQPDYLRYSEDKNSKLDYKALIDQLVSHVGCTNIMPVYDEEGNYKYSMYTFRIDMETVQEFVGGMHFDNEHPRYDKSYFEDMVQMNQILLELQAMGDTAGGSITLTQEAVDTLNGLGAIGKTRAEVLRTAFSLLGKCPYFYGGKYPQMGANAAWGEMRPIPVSSPGGQFAAGDLYPYGMDCSGFTQWVYLNALNVDIGAGPYQWTASPIKESELQPGDLGWARGSHVGIFVGIENGRQIWIHLNAGAMNVSYGTYSFPEHYRVNIDFDETPEENIGDTVISGGNSAYKSYMSRNAVTAKDSEQYKLLFRDSKVTVDELGFCRYGEDYVVALGSYYASGGSADIGNRQRFKITMENGTAFTAICGDLKADKDTDATHQYHLSDGSYVEFVMGDKEQIAKEIRQMGDCSYAPNRGLDGAIKSIVRLA